MSQPQTMIYVGDRITVTHPLDDVERSGTVTIIHYMAERDDVFIDVPGLRQQVILQIRPGTKDRIGCCPRMPGPPTPRSMPNPRNEGEQ